MINYCDACLLKYKITKKELFEVKTKKEVKMCMHVYEDLLLKYKAKNPPPATPKTNKVI